MQETDAKVIDLGPCHTIMEQCRKEAEYQFEEQTGFIAHSGSVTPQFWIGGYAQALYSERSKRPTVEQVMEVVKEEVFEWWNKEEVCRSRLTKLLGDGE